MSSFAGRRVFLGLALLWASVALVTFPAGAQVSTAPLLEKPAPPEEKKEEAPTTCGPLISDSCIPIETHHASLQVLWAWSFYRANFSPNWRQVSTKGDFYTFNMPVKFTYGPTKDLEMYIIAPYIHNLASGVDTSKGDRSADFGGIGDITAVAKYLLLPETDCRPAVTGVFGVGFPSGHAHNLNPRFLGQDAIGSGAFTFTTGVNLYKWLKPFLIYSNIWFSAPVNAFRLRDDSAVRSHEYVTFNLAAEYPLSKRWVALLEMYSTWTWSNIYTPLGFQSPTTVLGVLPGIEFFLTDKWAFSAGSAFDLVGKFGGAKITPMFTVYRSF